MNYSEFTTALAQTLVLTDTGGSQLLTSFLPRIIEYAELRIYRQFDFLETRTSDTSAQTVAGMRSVAVPSQFIVVEGASLIIPAGKKPADAGATRIGLIRAQREFLDMIWPNESQTQAPSQLSEMFYSLFNEQVAAPSDTSEPIPLPSSIQIAPTADDAYHVEFTGTQRPAPLSQQNPTSFLSVYLPDLFLVAAMIAGHGYLLRNWSGTADDPQAALSWEKEYRILAEGIDIEELRKKSMSAGAGPYLPAPLAGQPATGGAVPKMAG